jgi:hypothetical protein
MIVDFGGGFPKPLDGRFVRRYFVVEKTHI